MRHLRDYSLTDWQRLRPLTHAYKSAIYRTLTAWYVRRDTARLDPIIGRVRDEHRPSLAVTIAFEVPWIVGQQIAAIGRRLADATLVVCDNSKDEDSAREIEAVCADAGAAYLRLPRNPTPVGSRSHALAINWAYRNLVCAVKPACFAFLDHDLIPTADVRLAALVNRQPFYGLARTAGERWFLWAGYCVFDGRYAARPVLDFSQDWFNGLDTGGANYRRLYRHFDRSALAFASYRHAERGDPLTGRPVTVEVVDDWLHVTNISGWNAECAVDHALLERVVAAAVGNECTVAER